MRGGVGSHLPPNSVVVKPHACMDVSVGLPGVQKVLGEALSKAHVGAATAPLPGVLQARAGRGQGWEFRDTVAQAFPALQCVQLQAVQLLAEGILVPAPGGITATSPQLAQGACVGYSMHHTSCSDGISEGTLPETCTKGMTLAFHMPFTYHTQPSGQTRGN